MESKLSTVCDAIASIAPEMELSISGFAHSLVPMTLVRALGASSTRPVRLAAVGEAWAADLLSATQSLDRVQFSNFMFEGWGRCRNFSRAVEAGRITVRDYSHFAMAMGLVVGGWGLSSVGIRSLVGSDMAGREESPFHTVEALTPDVALIHVHRADERGNGQIDGPTIAIRDQAVAAKRVIVSTERVVSSEEIAKKPDTTVVPSFVVSHVVEVPYGAHPTGMYGLYDADFFHIQEYMDASRSEEGMAVYLDRWVRHVTHQKYVEQLGLRRLALLRADPHLGYSAAMRQQFGLGGMQIG